MFTSDLISAISEPLRALVSKKGGVGCTPQEQLIALFHTENRIRQLLREWDDPDVPVFLLTDMDKYTPMERFVVSEWYNKHGVEDLAFFLVGQPSDVGDPLRVSTNTFFLKLGYPPGKYVKMTRGSW